MKKYFVVILLAFFPAFTFAQGIKSVSIHNNNDPKGWLYGISDEVDSITFDNDGLYQILNINGKRVPHTIVDVDSVIFSSKEAPVYFSCIKLFNNPAYYILRNTGYVRICGNSNGTITDLDAFINEIPICFHLDNEQRIQSIRTDSLDLYFDYKKEVIFIFGRFFSSIICDTIDNSHINNSRSFFEERNTTKNYMQGIVKSVGDIIKTSVVEKGLNKILGIDFSSSDSYLVAFRKAQLRSSLKDLIGLAGTIQNIQRFEDLSVDDILTHIAASVELHF